MKLEEGRVPPGGWWFEMGGGVTLRGATKELLIKVVFEHRLRNNIEIGDIAREIDHQYCSRYPAYCSKEATDFGHPRNATTSSETMMNRVSRWGATMAAKMPRGGWPLVGQGEAERRGEICAHCPNNVPWRGGCAGCSRSAATLLTQVKGLRKTAWDSRVWGCASTGWENSVAINIQSESLPITAEQKAHLPENCWRKAGP